MPRTVTTVLALVLCAACSRAHRTADAVFDAEVSQPDSVVVRVISRADQRLAVAIERAGRDSVRGEVGAAGEGRFALRAADVTPRRVTLVATAVGGNANVRSVPVRVRAGQVMLFLVTPDLLGSQLYVRWPERTARR